nr:hypothetical protein Iba_chr03eCG6920 [Ipomoea batatas]
MEDHVKSTNEPSSKKMGVQFISYNNKFLCQNFLHHQESMNCKQADTTAISTQIGEAERVLYKGSNAKLLHLSEPPNRINCALPNLFWIHELHRPSVVYSVNRVLITPRIYTSTDQKTESELSRGNLELSDISHHLSTKSYLYYMCTSIAVVLKPYPGASRCFLLLAVPFNSSTTIAYPFFAKSIGFASLSFWMDGETFEVKEEAAYLTLPKTVSAVSRKSDCWCCCCFSPVECFVSLEFELQLSELTFDP